MKASHLKTPRTLADCDFTVGYPVADTRWKVRLETIWGLAVISCLGLLIGSVLAYWASA